MFHVVRAPEWVPGHGSVMSRRLRRLRLLIPHTGSMSVPEPGPTPLPERMQAALDGFGRHLAAERGLSPHTVRAYLGDVRSLLEHAAGDAITAPDGLDIAVLRRWLAS